MAKEDKSRANNAVTEQQDRTNNLYGGPGGAVNQANTRQLAVQGRSDSERANIWSGYDNLANNPGLTDAQRASLGVGGAPGGGGGGGGVGSGVASGYPDYLQTFADLSGTTGGYDPTRLASVTGDANSLRNSSSNYGTTNDIVGKLKDFASSGGVSADNISKIDNPTLEEFSRTGGFNDTDLANIRARSNAGVSSTYGNLQDTLDRQRFSSGQATPGLGAQGFKLARQGAQAAGENAQNTEVGIKQAVNAGRMSASSTLADKILSLSGLQSQNTLNGYSSAGNLDLTKNKQIADAIAQAGGLDNQTQGIINQSRLSAAGGLSQDYLGRASIGASSAAAANALAAQNARFAISEEDANRNTGLQGKLNTYGTAPAELIDDQNLTRGYMADYTNANQNLINSRIGIGGISSSPGWMSTVGDIAGIGGNLVGGLTGLGVGGGGNTGISGMMGGNNPVGLSGNNFQGNLTGMNGAPPYNYNTNNAGKWASY